MTYLGRRGGERLERAEIGFRGDQLASWSECSKQERWFACAAAFTLIELAIVVGILTILAALLLPALSRGKELSRATVCLSNLRQLGIAANVYAVDHEGTLPDFMTWLAAGPNNDAKIPRPGAELTNGALYPYLKNKDVYLCPTDKVILNSRRRGPPVCASSYAMNCFLCHNDQTARFVAPTRTLLFMEVDLPPDDPLGMVGPSVFLGVTNDFSPRHNGRGHLVFCDSHAVRVTASTQKQLAQSPEFWLPAPTTDQTSLYVIRLLIGSGHEPFP